MFEVEVKALVPNPNDLRGLIRNRFSVEGISSKQRNHYFSYSKESLIYFLKTLLPTYCNLFNKVFPEDVLTAENLVIRTRWDSLTGTRLMLKYSIDGSCSQNGTTRREFELDASREFELDANEDLGVLRLSDANLDATLLAIGFEYQSKWSRDRTEFPILDGLKIFVDTNAGYGGICEVERIVATREEIPQAQSEVKKILSFLKLDELDPGLLEEMFNFYSGNWQKFYGSQKSIFDDRRFQAILGTEGK